MSANAEQAGPFAGIFTEETGEAVEEWHEIIANFTRALIFIHIAAMIFASFVYRENLVRAIVTATGDHSRQQPNLTSRGQH